MNKYLSASQAQMILQFLSRVQISGSEAPSFMECVMALRMALTQETEASTLPIPTEGNK